MKRIINYLFVSLFFFFCKNSFAQDNAASIYDDLTISVLTFGPGEDLYSIFGHTALRLKNTQSNVDIFYNWGTFEFGGPTIKDQITFGLSFLRGKLPYALSNSSFDRGIYEYKRDKRFADEQVLDLTVDQKRSIVRAVSQNIKNENRYYKYDFYFDNCTTRIRDIIDDKVGGLQYPKAKNSEYTFRDLLHEHLGNFPWTQFGMDIVLGTQSDRVASQRDQMFLPFYFRDYLDKSTTNGKSVLKDSKRILNFEKKNLKTGLFTPKTVFLILLIVELLGFFLFYISGDRGFLKWFDRIWFVIIAFSSIVFLFMWFGTEHTVCANNYNLLWATPFALGYFTKKAFIKKIALIGVILGGLILVIFQGMLPQAFHIGVIYIAIINILKSARILGAVKWLDHLRKPAVTAAILLLPLLFLHGQDKIDGITMVAPPSAFQSDPMVAVKKVNADWIAVVPYGFSSMNDPAVRFGYSGQWWGERVEGIRETIRLAKERGIYVMIKPQVWIRNGWVGDFDFKKESEWLIWEQTYRDYLMTFVNVAIEHDVELICIGTEYRKAVEKRVDFWRDLIKEIRQKYSGRLTYSANWDDYQNVPIWDDLDYIGISAYFPLSEMDTPPQMLLSYRWKKYMKKLRKFSERFDKKILFTEYGYLSVDGAAGKTWELEKTVRSLDINEKAQANGYEALFSSFWKEDYWAGGFLWKWFPEGNGHEGYPERDYTPQNKAAEEVLSKWYGKENQ